MKRGVVGLFLVFVFMACLLVFLFGVATPVLMNWNVEMYSAGERILEHANIDEIQNETVRAAIQGSFDSALGATDENIEIMSYFYQYSWLIILIVLMLVVFLRSRSLVETDVI